jgi:GxxExxY protein
MREPSSKVDQLARDVIGAAIEVHRHLGPGYLESVYQSALAVEFRLRGITFSREHPLELTYKGVDVGQSRLDFLVGADAHRLLVELKTVEMLAPIHHAQVISYLKATQIELGLLINFNVRLLKDGIERVILTSP